MENKLGIRKWLTFILAGFVGQLAWAIENNYFNVYVYRKVYQNLYLMLLIAIL